MARDWYKPHFERIYEHFHTRLGDTLRPHPPKPPNKGLFDAAFDLNLPDRHWHNRTGERAQWRWLAWNDWADHPPPHVNRN